MKTNGMAREWRYNPAIPTILVDQPNNVFRTKYTNTPESRDIKDPTLILVLGFKDHRNVCVFVIHRNNEIRSINQVTRIKLRGRKLAECRTNCIFGPHQRNLMVAHNRDDCVVRGICYQRRRDRQGLASGGTKSTCLTTVYC